MGSACSGGTAGGESAAVEQVFAVPAAGVSLPVRSTRRLGWKRDLPDFRDRVLALPVPAAGELPASVDLRKGEFLGFAIYDQGTLGSCTANAIGAAFQFDQEKQGLKDFYPSRLFIYYNERAMEGSVDIDAGAYIRDGVKSVNTFGVCNETLWPYIESQFTVKPGDDCYTAATKNKCVEYARVTQTLDDMKTCLSNGYPFVFGFTVFNSFFSAEVSATGNMSMPLTDDTIAGGHAVLCVGYDDEKQVFIVRNSWGESWGDGGYFYMPYAYLSDPSLADDLWVMNSVTGTSLTTRAISAHVPAPAPALAPQATAATQASEGAERREA